jgi:hypothetical protein
MAIPLYPDFLENKNVYSLNVEHWSRLLHSVTDARRMSVEENTLTTTFNNGNYFFDGNPIFDAVVANRRAIRIIQQAPENDELNISAWIDQREVNGKLLGELVIDLELTEESQAKALSLLSVWFAFEPFFDGIMDDIIEDICCISNVTNAVMA